MSNPAVFGIIAQIEQSLQLLRTLLGQRAPMPPQFQPPQNQQYLSRQEEAALGEAVAPDYPPQFAGDPRFPQQPGYQQQYPQPPQQPQYQPPQMPGNQVAASRLLSQILGGGGN